MKMGALVAGASEDDTQKIYDFGRLLGIAFQLQDDYLDAFGNPETFGKQVGGDIIENKKTFLYLKAIENGSTEDKEKLVRMFANKNGVDIAAKIVFAKEVFERSGASELTKQAIKNYTKQALQVLDSISVSDERKQVLKDFGESLMYRTI